jgi:transketolase
MKSDIEQTTVDTLRLLAADMIQKANSGHPGLPLGAAPAAYSLFAKCMKYNPKNPAWDNRDRFVLSAGHGSALLYSLLHIFGFDLSLDDLKQFRQWGSKTPGHPEFGHTCGVEITTGPLGQGIANAVGMALAESHLAARFNKQDLNIVDHYTYALCGDGCLMEGVSAEASSLAGTLGLGKLIVLYDSNDITIDGDTKLAFRENVLMRYKAYNWHTEYIADGKDIDAIVAAIEKAKFIKDRPSIIEIKTVIGFGAPNKQGKSSAHGEPLGEEELKLTKEFYGFDKELSFNVPEKVTEYVRMLQFHLENQELLWNNLIDEYAEKFPEDFKEYRRWHELELPEMVGGEGFWDFEEGAAGTRVSSGKVLNRLCGPLNNLIGGTADLAESTKAYMKEMGDYSDINPLGRNIHFGIREHAMGAIANGIAAHGGLRVFVSGFFVFSDYMKPAMRLSALMKLPVIYVLTHDSVGIGEDGPTHEPVEQLAMLRSIPNFTVIRPCDARETAAAWQSALTRKTSPTAIVLSRQNAAQLKGTGEPALKGAYILKNSRKAVPDIILMASGSEVELIYKAYEKLAKRGIDARIVSMPSFELFEEQSEEYKESVLPVTQRKRLAVEAAASFGWGKYVGIDGEIIAVDRFGASSPCARIFEEFGLTVENVVDSALRVCGK